MLKACKLQNQMWLLLFLLLLQVEHLNIIYLRRYDQFEMCRMDGGQWTPASRLSYNLRDTISRCTVQVRCEL
jgi:hypothetical protein